MTTRQFDHARECIERVTANARENWAAGFRNVTVEITDIMKLVGLAVPPDDDMRDNIAVAIAERYLCQRRDMTWEDRTQELADEVMGVWRAEAFALAKTAIAAAAREGGDAKQAPGNAPQSGGTAASPDLHGGIA